MFALKRLPSYLNYESTNYSTRTHIDPKLEHVLQRYSNTAETPVAVFDCDNTLIKGDIGESMFYFQLEHFLLRVSPAILWPDHPKKEELKNLYDGLSALPAEKAVHDRRFISFAELMLDWYFDQLAEGKTAKACSDIVRLLADFTPEETRQIAHTTMTRELSSPIGTHMTGRHVIPRGIRFIKESVELLKRLRTMGFDIWVVSGSNQWSVEAVCEHIGVPKDHVIGISLKEKDGAFIPEVQQPVPVLKGKIGALQQRVMAAPLIVVSDSTYDIPLFNYATDLKVLVKSSNGQDFFLKGNVTRDEHWLFIETPTLTERP